MVTCAVLHCRRSTRSENSASIVLFVSSPSIILLQLVFNQRRACSAGGDQLALPCCSTTDPITTLVLSLRSTPCVTKVSLLQLNPAEATQLNKCNKCNKCKPMQHNLRNSSVKNCDSQCKSNSTYWLSSQSSDMSQFSLDLCHLNMVTIIIIPYKVSKKSHLNIPFNR